MNHIVREKKILPGSCVQYVKHNNAHLCVYMYMYIYRCMCVCGWVAKERILSSATVDSVGLFGEVSLCKLLVGSVRAKNGQRSVPARTHLNLREGTRPEVGVEKEQGRWSVNSKTGSRRN